MPEKRLQTVWNLQPPCKIVDPYLLHVLTLFLGKVYCTAQYMKALKFFAIFVKISFCQFGEKKTFLFVTFYLW